MIKSVFSVFDKKAQRFGAPQLVESPAVFMRDFQDYLRREPTSVVAEHPEDFTVFCVASFDDESGEMTPFAEPHKMVDVSVLVVKSE